MADSIYANLTQLGQATALPASPDDAVLERVANPQAGIAYNVRFTVPEFTSLCPMTGQPARAPRHRARQAAQSPVPAA